MASFNDLPAEVRNIMYKKLLKDEGPDQRRGPHELAMFTVSKQLHHETSSYFYKQNNIAIDASSRTTDTATILPPIADKYLRFLKRLTIHASTSPPSTPSVLKVATAIVALTTIDACFDELNLVISSPLSHLLNSRVDDTIMDDSHPITSAIQTLLRSGATKVLRIHLEHTCFAIGIAQALQLSSGAQLELYVNGSPSHSTSTLERGLTGRYSNTHLSTLGLDDRMMALNSYNSRSSPLSTSVSLSSSLCSAFAELDTFSVSSFELVPDEAEKSHLCSDSIKNDTDMDGQPYFTQDDIAKWSASAEEVEEVEEDDEEDQILGEMDDIDEDDDEEHVRQHTFEAILQNMNDAAHHIANGDDVTYMTNFAPELLLSRHHLGHLA